MNNNIFTIEGYRARIRAAQTELGATKSEKRRKDLTKNIQNLRRELRTALNYKKIER